MAKLYKDLQIISFDSLSLTSLHRKLTLSKGDCGRFRRASTIFCCL